jgi:DNA topoisomerase III
MELQMKAICDGRASRNIVVQQNIEQYRAVYNRTREQMSVLRNVRPTPPENPDKGLIFFQAVQKYVLGTPGG